LIRDQAVSLAVSVQRKLDGLVNLDSCQTNAGTTWRKAVNSLEQLVVRGTNSSNQDRELVNENHHIDKDMSSPNENNYQERDRHGLSRGVTGDFVEGVREDRFVLRWILTHRPTALLFPEYDLLMMQLRNKL
jgi:hypothetical protein